MREFLGVVVACAAASMVCGACSVDTSGNVVGRSCAALTMDSPAPASLASPFQGTVFTIVIENKSRSQMLSGSEAPYFQSLAKQYTVANGYTDARVHPSEPNYIWMAAGQNFGILDDDDPVHHHIASTSHLVDQIERVGKTWKTYQESMGEPCTVTSHGRYAAKHNPFIFFDDVVGWEGDVATRSERCRTHVVDYSELAADLASGDVPDYVFITPDLVSDMHDGTIRQGDDWLAREVPKLLASPAWQDGGVLFLTADEGEGRSFWDWSQEDDPPFLVISPLAKQGYTSTEPYDTSDYLATVQAILGVEPLPCGEPGEARLMDDLFTEPLPAL